MPCSGSDGGGAFTNRVCSSLVARRHAWQWCARRNPARSRPVSITTRKGGNDMRTRSIPALVAMWLVAGCMADDADDEEARARVEVGIETGAPGTLPGPDRS